MIEAIEKLYVAAGNETGSLVIPVGLAFDEAYRRRPDADLHQRLMIAIRGCWVLYLAASVVYASLYGASPIGNPYDYFGQALKDQVIFLQQVAHDTINRFYGR
jgi:hypothetical protein